MTRYEAHIRKDWGTAGLSTVIVVKHRDDASADAAFILVDLWCLGVKNAFAEFNAPASWVEERIREQIPDEDHERLHPACAKKLIEGAVAYAERLGFAPHRDYRKARKVFSGIDASVCPSDFTFGREGKPCYIAGQDDSPERINRVLAILETRCGEGGFQYVYPEETEDAELSNEELRDALSAWLENAPDSMPRFYELSGLVTAVQLCPLILPPESVFKVLSGKELEQWKDSDELTELASLLFEYWGYVADLLAAATSPGATAEDQAIDIWMADFQDGEMGALLVATYQWAKGFMRATGIWSVEWAAALAQPELAAHWQIIRWWSTVLDGDNIQRLTDAMEAGEARPIGDAVIALAKALRHDPEAEE